MSIIRCSKKRHPYVQIDKTPLLDKRLSWKARGLLAYLMTKPDDWEISVTNLIDSSDRDGREAVQSGLKELETVGYVVRQKVQDARGRFTGWDTLVFETPEDASDYINNRQPENPSIGETDNRKAIYRHHRKRENRQADSPPSENPPQLINDYQLINDLTNSPFIPQRKSEGERKEESQTTTTGSNRLPLATPANQLELLEKEASSLGVGKHFAATSQKPLKRHEPAAEPNNPQKCEARSLLNNSVFIQWWASRVKKTKFGIQELEMPPIAYVKARIRKYPEQALDMYTEFQVEMTHRVEVFNQCVKAGMTIADAEHEEMATIAPYAQVPLLTSSPVLTTASIASFSTMRQMPVGEEQLAGVEDVCITPVVLERLFKSQQVLGQDASTCVNRGNFSQCVRSSAKKAQLTKDIQPSSDQTPNDRNHNEVNPLFSKLEPPNYQEQEQNIRRLAQMVKALTSMPKQNKRQVEHEVGRAEFSVRHTSPTSQFEKMRSWLTSGDRILRSEAIAWAYKSQDTTVLFDESGDPYDFQKIEALR